MRIGSSGSPGPFVLLAAPLLLAGCGATPNPAPPSQPRLEATQPSSPAPPPRASVDPPPPRRGIAADPAPQPVELVVATVGEEPIGATSLILRWLTQNPLEVREILSQVVISELVVAESQRLGLRVEPELVEAHYLELIGDLQEKIDESLPGTTMDEWIATRLGLPPEFYLAQARADVIRNLLAERIVRAFTLSQERVTMRVVIAPDRRTAEDALRRAKEGEDFAALARELSTDASAERGGLLPPLPRNRGPLSRLAFQTPVGELGGPLREQGGWIVLRVEELHAPVRGPWSDVKPAVEQSLTESPIQDLEYLQWKAAMEDRYQVDTTPLLDLVAPQQVPPEQP